MIETTENKLIKVIETLTDEIVKGIDSTYAMKFTQACLNIAHTISILRSNR